MKTRKNLLSIAAMVSSVNGMYFGLPALAQADNAILEEITVTAQRREQNLQEVPVSVTAFDAGAIERSNITEAKDYLLLTPNVSFQEDGQSGNKGVSISIRGISDIKTGENSVTNSIGVYLNEFSVVSVSNGTINPALQDIERIEVLRGPQGTYFGRNAVGGALNITTKKPTDEFEGEIAVGLSSFEDAGDTQSITGIVNIPVSDTFALRAVGNFETSSGLVENVNPAGADDSGYDSTNLRLSMRWSPSDATTVDLLAMYTDQDEGHDPTVPSGTLDLDTESIFGAGFQPIDDFLGFFPNNQNKINHNTDEENKTETTLLVLNISHDLSDTMTFKSITGLITTDTERLFDQDNISADAIIRTNEYEGESWSQEFRLEIINDQYDWISGVLYAEDDQEQYNLIAAGTETSITIPGRGVVGLLPPFVTPGFRINENNKDFETTSFAVFTDFTWHVNDRLDLTIGGRYTRDEVETGLSGVIAFEGASPDVDGDEDFTDFSPRFVAAYQLNDDVNLYGVISKGYKSGGIAVGHEAGVPFARPFDEEEITNFELGIKSQLLDDRVRFNASVFYMKWDDMQMESFFLLDPTDISSNVELTRNVDEATSMGFELEFLAALTENLVISAGYGYVDTEIDHDDIGSPLSITGNTPVSLDGRPIPKSPENTANITAEYRWDTASGEAYVRGEWAYRSDSFADIEGLAHKQLGRPSFPYELPSFDVFNLRAGMSFNEHFFVDLYVENLFEEDYYTSTQENFGLAGIRLKPNPRTIGANVRYKF